MPTPNKHYCITPSQLDAFQAFIDSDATWESLWGNSDEPSKTAHDYSLECEAKLIDQINRCPKVPIEAADKGTVVNELVDMLVNMRRCEIEGMEVCSTAFGDCVRVQYNGFEWVFSKWWIYDLAKRYPNALSQYRCQADLQTDLGLVTLYGYIDEWCGDKIYDIKTTRQYQFGKFEDKWQRHVYPYCVVASGQIDAISEFEFSVVVLSKTPVTDGTFYREVYTYNHEDSTQRLIGVCESFITWLESRRELITDKRIFGGENPDGYVGTPIDKHLLT